MIQRIAAKLGKKPEEFMVVYKDDSPAVTPHKADKAAHQLEKAKSFLKGLRLQIDGFPDKTKKNTKRNELINKHRKIVSKIKLQN